MTERKTSIHGLSIVDATTNETASRVEDNMRAVKDQDLLVRIEDESDATARDDDGCEEIMGDDSFLEETEEKINLFDALDQKDELEKENINPVPNPTLIITTEEHLESITCEDTLNTSTETVKNFSNESNNTESNFDESKKIFSKSRPRNENQGYFWVSNISRHVKATNLKKFFSQMGKVLTAKVLTNGKNYFGYVSVDSTETAAKCIKQLNNTFFEGKKVTVSKERPDLREARSAVKVEPRRRKSEQFELRKSRSTESKITTEEKSKTNTWTEEKDYKSNDAIIELNNKLEKLKAEANRYKYKVLEYQRRHEGMRKKCTSLEKELKEIQYQIRADRRRLNLDREQFEKNKKLELIRMETDKTLIGKELGEVKKLREHLKAKIDEISAQSKKNAKRRDTRSPPPPLEPPRSPRGRSPVMRIGSRVTYRSDNRTEKKRKRDEAPHGRTPPPPPKLTSNVCKKRDNLTHRQYFAEFEKRPSSLERGHVFEYRHKPPFPPAQELPRAPWQASYPKDPRRLNAAPSNTPSYPSDPRYGGGYQFPPSSVSVPPRSYYPEFGKPYGHY